MPDLDAKGLEAAAKALSHDEGIALWDEWTPAAQSDLLTAAEAAIRAYLTAAGRAAAPDDDDGPFREDLPAILQSVRDGQGTGHYEHPVVPLHIALAAVTRAEAAGRAAATPDPPKDAHRPWPIAPDTVMPPRRQPVRWGSRADDPPTEIHNDPQTTKAYLAGLAAGRTEAAASPDERLREAARNMLVALGWDDQTDAARALAAALAAADRGTACTDRENAGVGGAVTRGIVPSGTDDPAAADREKPEER